ncbi:MAG: DUF2911 domain-containing protein [Gemmatimonadetes bacterium]|nr:DUF2911 domain-containing protein [Gemmatimonadota bacterium]NNM03605.1 DUF2911 domain-containing protein [Gemmatimonadota bacterium]
MGFQSILPSAVVAVVLFAGCGPAGDEEPEVQPGAEAAAEGAMSAAEVSDDVSCWLRGATLEETMERPSPLGQTDIDLDGHVGRFCYGRPSANGRVVEGGLIPFGEPWRMGANEATAIHLPFAASVGGVELQPGSYSIYAVAGEFEWEFFLNSNAERWGVPIDGGVMAQNVGSFSGLPRTMTEPVEQLTVNWHAHEGDNGHLVFEWGTTRVEIEVSLPDHVH